MLSGKQYRGWVFAVFAAALFAFLPRAHASATLLLEEPYGKLGFFTGTGHAAVYLSNVCAETPLVLRRCRPGELGAVISRYDGIGRYDWVAIPLIPYLYAVDRTQNVPLFADAKLVAFLRDRYRRDHLEQVAPDLGDGETPSGNWYELVGSSYDRTIYGFEIETTPAQDDALIRKLNSLPNDSHFHTVYRNCADFARQIINFYYPKALHRSFFSDLGISTPKQMAKMIVRYSDHHRQLRFSRTVFPQVPGSMPRSTVAHGVVESFFKQKKYIVPSALVSPVFAGCVAAAYVSSGTGRFNPAQSALVLSATGITERPLDREDQLAYRRELDHLLADQWQNPSGAHLERTWGQLQAKATRDLDENGRPVLLVHSGTEELRLGLAPNNLFFSSSSSALIAQMLEARLYEELHRTPRTHLTEADIERDWGLLERAIARTGNETAPLHPVLREARASDSPSLHSQFGSSTGRLSRPTRSIP